MSGGDEPLGRFDDLLARHLADGLDAAERSELAGLAASRPELAGRLREHARLHVLLAETCGGADARAMVARVLHGRSRRGDSAHFVRQVVRRAMRRRETRTPAWRWGWALAATVLVGIGLGLALRPDAQPFASIVSLIDGPAEIAGQPVRAGDAWPAGQPLALADRARLEIRLHDGSTLSVTGGARLTGEDTAEGLRLDLSQGRIVVSAAPQAPGRTLVVASAHARISVLGTRYVVEAGSASTRIEVHEGRVAVAAAGQRQELIAGDRAEASAGSLRIQPFPRRIEVLFGPPGIPLPAGALLDQAKAWDEVRGYGWDGDPEAMVELMTADHGLVHRKRVIADPVFSGRKLVAGHVSAGIQDEDRWRMRLPSGLYHVTVTVGDLNYPQGEHRVLVEGVTLVAGVVTDHELHQGGADVEVRDGELTMQVGGSRRPYVDGTSDTLLNRLVIERLEH